MIASLQALGALFLEAWPAIAAFDIGRYLIAATVMALILQVGWNAGLAARKIQARTASAADVRRELTTSLRTAVVFSLVGFGIFLAVRAGWLTVYDELTAACATYFAVSLAGMIVAHDAYFYWMHRLMHHPLLFRWFHRTHHKSVTPTPFAAYAFDLPEAVVQAAFMPLFMAVVPMHVDALYVFMAFMIVRNVMGHAGAELHPRGMASSRRFGWICGTTHHDLHHSSFRYNYGLYFTWWDRLMGTEHPDYRARYRAVTEGAAGLAARPPAVQP